MHIAIVFVMRASCWVDAGWRRLTGRWTAIELVLKNYCCQNNKIKIWYCCQSFIIILVPPPDYSHAKLINQSRFILEMNLSTKKNEVTSEYKGYMYMHSEYQQNRGKGWKLKLPKG